MMLLRAILSLLRGREPPNIPPSEITHLQHSPLNETKADSTSSLQPTLGQPTLEMVYFDPHGDTRILVNDADMQKIFVTTSKAMSFVCGPWNKMVGPDGQFKEAKVGKDGMKDVSLPEDDTAALTILLNIAHLRFEELPKEELTFDRLRALIVLSNKYCATVTLKPWLTVWTRFAHHATSPYQPGHEECLFIFWELGLEDKFESLARKMAREIQFNDDGKCVNAEGRVLDHEGSCYFPPGILGTYNQSYESRNCYIKSIFILSSEKRLTAE